jgi:RNA polymerase sigma factor FliA
MPDDEIERWRPLVCKIARRMPRRLLDFDDLVAVGLVGVMDAYERFDPGRGVGFYAFASPRIAGAMVDAMRQVDWVPRSVRDKGAEVSEPLPLDAEPAGPGSSLYDMLADDVGDPAEVVTMRETAGELSDAVGRLPASHQRVIHLHFVVGLTVTEIGRVMGFTQGRASQIKTEALHRLRASLRPLAAA